VIVVESTASVVVVTVMVIVGCGAFEHTDAAPRLLVRHASDGKIPVAQAVSFAAETTENEAASAARTNEDSMLSNKKRGTKV